MPSTRPGSLHDAPRVSLSRARVKFPLRRAESPVFLPRGGLGFRRFIVAASIHLQVQLGHRGGSRGCTSISEHTHRWGQDADLPTQNLSSLSQPSRKVDFTPQVFDLTQAWIQGCTNPGADPEVGLRAVHTGSVANCSADVSALCSVTLSYTGSVFVPSRNTNQ